ncbi:CotH kinase family protein [Lysinibacillus piscis]|uniref:Spore coat protein n=1 Tax=Lysinibacillus piscis TaxID=2518931 RepID=A0ABQ5NPU3_9BACI|nr:CotH kinase family protein [Lysinibacillus sp. KH24]GLC90019.1 spore coat protein [Lysinibacillus sp. KH24]
MVKSKIVYLCMTVLLLLFILLYTVLPNIGIETKNTEFSYENIIFNENKVTTVDIEIAEEDWQDMLDNAADEEIQQATITVNGKKVDNVGIRTKGNSSLTSVVNSDSNRYSLKVDFDYYDNTQSLYGLKKLNLNNNFSDTTLMREYISYELMEQMGLPTPAHSYMYVTVNGEDFGLYVGVEAVDETFLANQFGSNNGFLYKPDGVGSDLKYISDSIEDYTGIAVKTNESNIDESKLIEMIDAINNGGDIEKYIDVDEMLRYFAMNTALVSLDSYQGMMKHNYYLYEENGVFSIIPWDYNMAFGGFRGNGRMGGNMPNETSQANTEHPVNKEPQADNEQQPANARGAGMGMGMTGELMTDSAINFSITSPVSGASLEDRPLLNALLTNEEYRAQYEAYLDEIATKYLTESNIQEMTKKLAVLLTTYVEADPTKFSTTEEFLAGVEGENSLPEFAKQRSASILKQLSGELVVEAETQQEGGMPNFGDIPENGQMPDFNNMPEDFDSSKMPPMNEEMNKGERPNGMQPSDRNNGGFRGMPNGNKDMSATQDTTIDPQYLIVVAASCILLLIALVVVLKFNRRGRP